MNVDNDEERETLRLLVRIVRRVELGYGVSLARRALHGALVRAMLDAHWVGKRGEILAGAADVLLFLSERPDEGRAALQRARDEAESAASQLALAMAWGAAACERGAPVRWAIRNARDESASAMRAAAAAQCRSRAQHLELYPEKMDACEELGDMAREIEGLPLRSPT